MLALQTLVTTALVVQPNGAVLRLPCPCRAPAACCSALGLSPSKEQSSAWQTKEEWALLDDMPAYTVGTGKHTVTFWSSLAAANPVLIKRSPEELQSHAARIADGAVWREPKVLCSAARRSDGTWMGKVDGHNRVLNVASEGHLASGDGFVESLTGEIFQLDLISSSALDEWPAETKPVQATMDAAMKDMGGSVAAIRARNFTSLGGSLFVSGLVAGAMLISAQLVTLGVHQAAPAAVRASWQQERVLEARKDVLELERWLEVRREAFDADQETFIRRMGDLEPRLRASEARLAELRAAAVS